MGKRKRTNLTYRIRETGQVIIDKKKKDMTDFERFLIKNNQNYTNEVPEKELTIEEKLEKKERYLEKQRQRENDDLWKDVEKFKKNPKKYNDKLSKREKKIMKFFNRKGKGKQKLSKNDKDRKKAMSDILYYDIYMDMVSNRTNLYDELDIKPFKEHNPNKRFMNNVGERNYSKEKILLLETLEEEILSKLEDDFSPDNVVVRYKNHENKKKDKKKKKKKENPERFII